MENGILVSVVIPVFNVKPFLREALDSVLHQTYENLEIIIVDDGSTDGSGEICDEYVEKDKRVAVIRQENQGLSSARNAALDRITGEGQKKTASAASGTKSPAVCCDSAHSCSDWFFPSIFPWELRFATLPGVE